MSDFERLQVLQSKLPVLLEKLANQGKAVWFRRSADHGLVYCALDSDLLIFELNDGTQENVNPFDDPHGICLRFRNQRLLWLEGSEGWDCLVQLTRDSDVNDENLQDAFSRILEKFVKELEVM